MCAVPLNLRTQTQTAALLHMCIHNRNMLLDRVHAKTAWSTCLKPASPCAITDITWGWRYVVGPALESAEHWRQAVEQPLPEQILQET